MAKKILSTSGIVFSTNPDFKLQTDDQEEQVSLEPGQQVLKIKLQTKHRAGKAVTLVEGYIGSDEEKENLCKRLKTFCGTGGSFKENEIIIQGDNREKILQWLQKNSFTKSKKV